MLLADLFLLRDTPYRHAAESPRSPLWMALFLLGVGGTYGALVARFQASLGAPIQGIPLERIPGWILYGGNLVSGMLVALVFHGGVTLVVWLMARAVGGPGRLAVLYRACAYLLPLGLPALPLLALQSAAQSGPVAAGGLFVYRGLALVSAGLVLAGLYRLLRVTQGTSPARSALAAALFALFSGSILLLT